VRFWPWRTKRGRTVEKYDTIGRLRVLCIKSGAAVTGEEIEIQLSDLPRRMPDGRWQTRMARSRVALCPECNHKVRVTGLKSRPRLTVHNVLKKR
jgi:hypothetical protein